MVLLLLLRLLLGARGPVEWGLGVALEWPWIDLGAALVWARECSCGLGVVSCGLVRARGSFGLVWVEVERGQQSAGSRVQSRKLGG